jgi:hypothetical protein
MRLAQLITVRLVADIRLTGRLCCIVRYYGRRVRRDAFGWLHGLVFLILAECRLVRSITFSSSVALSRVVAGCRSARRSRTGVAADLLIAALAERLITECERHGLKVRAVYVTSLRVARRLHRTQFQCGQRLHTITP